MADYIGYTRANYFKVKSVSAFQEFIEGFGFTFLLGIMSPEGVDGPGEVSFIDDEGSGIPDRVDNEETGESEEFNFEAELAKHLSVGSVAEIRHLGHEKMRYLSGYTTAISWNGETFCVSLDDIYEKVRRLWGSAYEMRKI